MTQRLYPDVASGLNRLRQAYLWACLIELEALKPGNVSRHHAGHGMCARDFTQSANASVEPLLLGGVSLGERIYRAVEATHHAVGCNTNLGIVLLCAPLMHAFMRARVGQSLRDALHGVLRTADMNDAVWTFRAIRLASPGGLGSSDIQDVRTRPSVSLTEAMRLAAHRDRIAFQYVSDFEDVFDFALPSLQAQADIDAVIVARLFLRLLARFPDSHIVRKFGIDKAREIRSRAAVLEAACLRAGTVDRMNRLLEQADVEFKADGINPGTSADLTVATLLVTRLEELLDADERDSSVLEHRERSARISCPRIG